MRISFSVVCVLYSRRACKTPLTRSKSCTASNLHPNQTNIVSNYADTYNCMYGSILIQLNKWNSSVWKGYKCPFQFDLILHRAHQIRFFKWCNSNNSLQSSKRKIYGTTLNLVVTWKTLQNWNWDASINVKATGGIISKTNKKQGGCFKL